MPLNIYVAFYRYGCGAAKATVPNLDMEQLPSVASKEINEMFKAPEIPTLNVTLDIDTQDLRPKIITPREGIFVQAKEKTKFLEQLSLKPKVLTVKPPPTRRAKKDDDTDYVPSLSDQSEEDDPTIVTVPEPKPKGIKVWQIPFVMDSSRKHISILHIM
ncbi:MAG: hypothetical protein MJE68_33360 [Proteobacteria bacterium]|nr:hypothetical protein [Pseudomonadota bacterium]